MHFSDIGLGQGNRVLWGMWQVRIDLKKPGVEIVPLRDSVAHINVVDLLEPPALTFLSIDESTLSISTSEGIVEVDVLLRHPLPKNPEYTGFDVRGIVITDGSYNPFTFDSSLRMSRQYETRLTNADGYTRWWNPTEFTGDGILGYTDGLLGMKDSQYHFSSTINGFKYFADGLGPDDPIMKPLVLLNRGRFSVSSTNRRHYVIDFGPGPSDFMVFNYAVDTSWEEPANIPPQTIDDFPMSASCLEPFNIDITEEANSLYFDPTLEDCPISGGVLRLRIDVATWHGVGGIGEVLVGSPDLDVAFFDATEVSGSDLYEAHISTYRADLLAGEIQTSKPDVFIVAKSPLGSYTQGPAGFPIKFKGPSDEPLALYELHCPSVGTNSPPQVGPIVGPTEVEAGEVRSYQVSGYYDCQDSANLLTFAWESGDDVPPLYNDGYGNTDGVHPKGNGTFETIFHEGGLHVVDAKVLDTEGRPGFSEAPLSVMVTLPEKPEFLPGSNLVLTLKRNILNSYEFQNPSDPTDEAMIQLDWSSVQVSGTVEEWVVYRNDDPYDEDTPWTLIDTIPSQTTQFRNRFNGKGAVNPGGAYYYCVKARSLEGVAGTESENSSELAFIEFENAEIQGVNKDQHPWSMGYGGANPAQFRQWERPGYGGAVSGACWMCDPDTTAMYQNTWSVIASPPLPILTDPALATTTSEWYIELILGGQVLPNNLMWSTGEMLSVGTVPDDPSTHNTFATYLTYDESPLSAFLFGTAFDTPKKVWYTGNRFDDTPSTYLDRLGWGWNEHPYPVDFARYRLPGLDPAGPARVRAAIGWDTSQAFYDMLCRPQADEIAVVIY
jgi:hypothetical protein